MTALDATVYIDPTPFIVFGIAKAALVGGALYAAGSLLGRLADRLHARAAARRAARAAKSAQVPPAAPAPPPRRDGVPTRALTDAPTTAYRPERP